MVLTQILYSFLKNTKYRKLSVRYGGRVIRAEVADNMMKQGLGLMHRKSMGAGEGMLFIFATESKTMTSIWMYNMLFAIDVVWADSGKRIVDMVRNARPSRYMFDMPYAPRKAARYVLEVNAGVAKKLGMRIGGRLSFRA